MSAAGRAANYYYSDLLAERAGRAHPADGLIVEHEWTHNVCVGGSWKPVRQWPGDAIRLLPRRGETRDIRPFSGKDVTCPKCGGVMGEKWVPSTTNYIAPASNGAYICNHDVGPEPVELLHRSCRDCGFGWPEYTADAVE